jgi:hypothetical protein
MRADLSITRSLFGHILLYHIISTVSSAACDTYTGTQPIAGSPTVDPCKELVITHKSVIQSLRETTFDPTRPAGTAAEGAWSFGRLIHNMLPQENRDSAAAASALVMAWLKTWETHQRPNPTVSPALARPSIRLLITNPWKADSGCPSPHLPDTDDICVLDMRKAPFRLTAIVNRMDLRSVADEAAVSGGEGRFVFQVLGPTLGVRDPGGRVEIMDPVVKPQKFTIIFEYALPARSKWDVMHWALRWHSLGRLPFGAEFNAALRDITTAFAGPDVESSLPNGNSLAQVRTNEVALFGARFPTTGFVAAKQFWELREFHPTSTGLVPHSVKLEPSRDYDVAKAGQSQREGRRTAELAAFLEEHAAAVLSSDYQVPPEMAGNSSLVGSAPYGAWGKTVNPNPPDIPSKGIAHGFGNVPVAVRDTFALNTCAGCHRHETDTRHFMHITALAAMESFDTVDDRSRARVMPGTLEDVIVLSNFLKAEISPGGDRFEDFVRLLQTGPAHISDKRGLRACAPSR